MKNKIILLSMSAIFLLSGCAEKSEGNIIPLMNLEWFSEMGDVKNKLTDYDLLKERENTDNNNHQDLLDYSGTELFETDCDLTLCFINQGLVGFNYHDIERHNNYNEWFEKIETIYGIPTEKGSGMASWYDDPVGKSTALYLFNLEEGVQISFYATSTTPDKSYSGQDKDNTYIPTPELRTPIVPFIDDNSENTKESTTVDSDTAIQTLAVTGGVSGLIDEDLWFTGEISEDNNETEYVQNTDISLENTSTTDKNSSSTTVSVSSSGSVTTVSTVTTTAEQDKKEEFKQDVLQFYATPEFERRRMSKYNQVYEYKTEEAGQPWELIMQYENVPYFDKKCDTVLCFPSLGLIGINYFDDDNSDYDEWVEDFTEIYGSPTDFQNDYTAWNNSPLGENTMIYIFVLEDGVQISFFADDTGSELS